MTVDELLSRLTGLPIRLRRKGDELVVRAPEGALDPELVRGLRAHKADLLDRLALSDAEWWTPPARITPEMLPLVELSQEQIDKVAASVPGGAGNVQDIYPLGPLQEGIFFHHLMDGEGDPYLGWGMFAADSRSDVDRFVGALQTVVDRHDILRTAVAWEGLPQPVQVVRRHARLPVEEVTFYEGLGAGLDAAEQLRSRFDPAGFRLDLRTAPLLRVVTGYDAARERWLLLVLMHHLVGDNATWNVLQQEISSVLAGHADALPEPVPYRNVVAQAALGMPREEHEEFFTGLLGDVDEPTAPFGLTEVHHSTAIAESRMPLAPALADAVREQARRAGVSTASVCHLAWGLVLSRLTGMTDVVFGSVLLGRTQGGVGNGVGLFINTLPVRIEVGGRGALDAVRDTQGLLAEVLRHEHAPLVVAQRCSQVPAGLPLFTTLLNYRHSAPADPAAAGNTGAAGAPMAGFEVLHSAERTNYPVMVSIDDLGVAGLAITSQVDQRVDPERVNALLVAALRELTGALAADPSATVAGLDVLPAAEREQLVEEFNATSVPAEADSCVHEAFQAQASATPDAVAVVHEDTQVTYRELNAMANRIAHRLRSEGVGPDVRVALCARRGVRLLAAMLGVVKAGGAYVPLDPSFPAERLAFMLADARPAVVLTDGTTLATDGVPILDLATDFADGPDTDLSGVVSPSDVAYVLYTSGSTGVPKGVVIEHSALTNFLAGMRHLVPLGSADTLLAVTTVAFDIAALELYLPLVSGARVVIASEETIAQPSTLIELIRRSGVSVAQATPSMWRMLASHDLDGIRGLRMLVGGEALPAPLADQMRDVGREVLNVYGPTETTIWSTAAALTDRDDTAIGSPILNTRVYVVDGYGRPVPVGVTGELFIGGLGVARGYWGRPGLTSERFVPDWLTGDGTRLYRTGDLVRWLPDGTLEYVGRNDFQVKVRGYRIELGEIEARLLTLDGVREAVVAARDDRLDAYYVADTGIHVETLRAALGEVLPSYMVPSAFVALDALPLTPNGKVDRASLPAPDGGAVVARGYRAPVGVVEEALAAIWADLLGVERVGRDDDFFELGGHSLLAVSLVERMREAELSCDVRGVFTTRTIAGLAAAVAAGGGMDLAVPPNAIPAEADVITPEMLPLVDLAEEQIARVVASVPGGAGNVQDIYPLGPLQEGIFFHHLMGGEGDAYLLSSVSAVPSREWVDAFAGALRTVVDRHDILRTSVVWQGLPQPVQVVWRRTGLPVEEVTLDANGDAAAQLLTRYDPRRYRLDLGAAPLLRVVTGYDAAQDRWLLLVLMHHLVGDHTTLGVVQEEIGTLLAGRTDALPEPVPYRNVVAQAVLGTSRKEHEEFFTGLLGDVDEPTAPYGVLDVRGDGTGIAEARVDVDTALARTVREQARRAGVSPASVCHLAWSMVLSRLTGRSDVVFGTVMFGRAQAGAGAERGLGLFVNTLPVRIDVAERGILDAARDTQRLLADVLRHEHAPLVLTQGCSQVPTALPLFTSLFNYRHHAPADTAATGAAIPGFEVLHSEERTNYPVVVSVDDGGTGFAITAQVDDRLDPDRVCRLLLNAIQEISQALTIAPRTPVSDLEILPQAERALVVEAFNATKTPLDTQICVHELFEQRAAAAPETVAVVHGDTQVTYRDLNAKANQIAHRLRSAGVGPDARVAICAQRGVPLLAAMLGVLKAGGAYVPLDPSYPAERLAFMLTDAQPAVILTDGVHLPAADMPVIELASLTDEPDTDLPNLASSTDMAYVLYTSGSTGLPKGVAVEHRNIVRLVVNNPSTQFTPDDRTAFAANPSFDAATWEIWGPLANGGTVVVIDQDDVLDPQQFATVLRAQSVSMLWITVGLFNRTHTTLGDVLSQLRYLIVGGDILDPSAIAATVGGPQHLLNGYGPTETTTFATTHLIETVDAGRSVPIGRPIGNTRIYLVDGYGRPVPVGVTGELFIGGLGVARGYLGRPGLTAERFVPDWLTADGTRLYRTGDLGRWLPDGTIEFVGRNDFQVKIRGYRIELGEIETRLLQHHAIREATVIARGDRLDAYYVPNTSIEVETLRNALSETLPSYMVPSAFVELDALPLTPNGKVDRDKLPSPDGDAVVTRGYQAPVGPVEEALAAIWADLLSMERVGRNDDFFELGGHSLLAVSLVERMREAGLTCDVRAVFTTPTIAGLATAIAAGDGLDLVVPPNAIPAGTEAITPGMLPLVELTEEQITQVVATVPGGAGNVQDIYPLGPLQEGIFFHHLMGDEGDAYLLSSVSAVPSREWVDEFAGALQAVVDRHDILRTSVVREGLPHPVQVVWRQTELPVEEVTLNGNEDATAELLALYDPRRYDMDLGAAPLLRVVTAYDATHDRWLLLVLMHHLVGDHTTLDVVQDEISALLNGRADALPEPVPYRNVVAQAVLGTSREEHEKFFTGLLGEVDEPTAPYGLLDVRGDGTAVAEAHIAVEAELAGAIRQQARRAGVSPASVCHLAWSMVLSRLTGRSDVVFGTVVFGRMQAGAGAERGLGLFINTLPIRVGVGARGVLDSVRDAHALLAEILRHEHAPLVLAQGCSQVPPGSPLFTSLLNYRHSAPAGSDATGAALSGLQVLHSEERTNYPVVVSVDDLGAEDTGFAITAQVDDRLDPDRVCGLLTAALRELTEALSDDPALSVSEVEVLPAAERALVVEGFNATQAPHDPTARVHELFEAHAKAAPDTVAVVHGDAHVTYRDLNAKANQIAHRLRSAGVGPDVRVGICARRGVPLLTAMLGVLKAGGAYLPMDPSFPAERVTFMLNDAQPAVVLTDNVDLPTAPMPVIDLADLTDEPDTDLPNLASSTDMAYVLYTSGSTGVPKGVAVEHRSIIRLVVDNPYVEFTPEDRTAFAANPAFDAATWEIWGPLTNGGAIVVIDQDTFLDPRQLATTLAANKVTGLFTTTALFNQAATVVPNGFAGLRYLFTGGERCDPAAFNRILTSKAAPQRLIHCYGPTETTTFATTFDVTHVAEGQETLPIGAPIGNTHIYIVDNHGRPVPVGVTGELFIGGLGVARGYLGRPGLTAERFLPNWLTADGTRLYRTGDLGRWLPDGTIEFVGRNDFQVKIRGYRIELGEIEARLLQHHAIRETIVIARDDRLNAYYVPAPDTNIDAETLREALDAVLPSYMVPSAFVELDALPLTPNGKVDRDKLPTPGGDAVVARGYQSPTGPVEEALAAIWADLLGVERIGRDDDFFELGGHSLLAVSLVERMREAKLSCDVRAVFTTPTIAGLATAVAAGGGTEVSIPPNAIPADATAITPDMLPLVQLTDDQITKVLDTVPGGAGNVQDIYPLAPLQEGIFFHHLMGGEGDAYLLSSVSTVPSREWIGDFAHALQAVVIRHDILRTAVVWEGLPQPVQVVWRHVEAPVEEVSLDGNEDAVAQLLARFDPRRYRLDLERAPLLRVVTAYDRPNGRWLLMVLMHHLVGDHTTLDVVQKEISALLTGHAHALPEPVPYRNVVAQAVLGTSRDEHEEFFTELLGDVDEPTAPYGLLDVRGDGTGIAEAQATIETDLADAIREQARQAGVSSASVCHLAWSMVLSRLTGRSDVVFGTVLFGRMQAGSGAERGIGLFINTLPVRVEVGARGALDAVRDTHALLAEVLRHEHAPLVVAQGCSQVPTGLPLFTTLLNYRHSAESTDLDPGGLGEQVEVLHSEERTNYPILVSIDDLGAAGLTITTQVDDLLDPEQVNGLLVTALRELTGALAADPAATVADLEVLPTTERALLVQEFNASAMPAEADACVHELFQAQASATPDALAVVHDDTQVTYRELNAMANRIAYRLRSVGVGPDVRVGLCAQRGVRLIAAMLGVLKAGGAYVPLDPSYPAERVAFMLTDARPAVVLIDGTALATDDVPVLDLVTDFSKGPDTDLPGVASPSDAAYVLYTSGSTGTPKGVTVEHRNTVNFLRWARSAFATEVLHRTLWSTSVNFDLAVFELFLPLVTGRTVVAVRDALAVRADTTDVTLVNTVPSAIAALADAREIPGSVRTINLAGEPLKRDLVDRIFAAADGVEEVRNLYGPSETTTYSTAVVMRRATGFVPHVGGPIGNTRLYVVDGYGRPAPVGVVGELFIGGRGVTRGYLGRPGLTAERFVPDWLSGDGSRLYRTGDLGRWLPDGTLEFVGRNDFQVKVRGYRIELGEIEARLLERDGVREAVVVARGDRLNAYYVAVPDHSVEVETLRDALSGVLPSYMVPSAFVELDALPLTPNGKVDRDKLPVPDSGAVLARGYRAPVGVVEEVLASIWADLLGVERVGRDDDFFELGGHSLLAVSLVERMREAGLSCDVRAVFTTPTIAGLATGVAAGGGMDLVVPPNAIPADAEAITPDMLSLVELTDEQIAQVVSTVPGGASNVQDVYPLAPLQEGIFFHHLMGGEGDAYLLSSVSTVPSREWVSEFAHALQTVVDRHDILRTSVVWEGLPQPVQVVWRHVEAPVEEVTLDGNEDAVTQLQARFDPRRYRLDLERAPLLRVVTAYDRPNDRWLLMVLMHHLVGDHTTLDVVQKEISALLTGHAHALPEPVPYRNVVAQAVLGTSREEHEKFFSELLGEVEEPTAPYGLLDVRGDGTGIAEAHVDVAPALARAVREQARHAGVSPASVCHLAWSMVLSRLTGRSDVVFGTVMFGRMQAGTGAERGLGLFINTLPVRVEVGARGALDAVRDTHALLAEVLRHEHAPLVVAQGCSQVPTGLPLFTSLLNYRHSAPADAAAAGAAMSGVEVLHSEERTNYPVVVSVDDLGVEDAGFGITAQVDDRLDPERVNALLVTALQELTEALADDQALSVSDVDVLPAEERALLVDGFNPVDASADPKLCLHEVFEAQVAATPDAVAAVHGDTQITYRELNEQANRVAYRLRSEGVSPGARVGICAERGVGLLAAIVGVLKAGGAYVPLDPSYPAERVTFVLADAQPAVVLTDGAEPAALIQATAPEDVVVWNLATDFTHAPEGNVPTAVSPSDVAYVIYTSGSTGTPKGVLVEHRQVTRLFTATEEWFNFGPTDVWALCHSYAFDFSVWEIWGALLHGGRLVVVPGDVVRAPDELWQLMCSAGVTVLCQTPGAFTRLTDARLRTPDSQDQLRFVIFGGEALEVAALRPWFDATADGGPTLVNMYGITETTVHVTWQPISPNTAGGLGGSLIGQPIPDLHVYVIDNHGRPTPVGVVGELMVGGRGVTRGYLGRPGLTAERFVPNWLTADGTRLYRTGDLGRWLPDGTLEYIGRNDFQVKIRGYRIELGEIEAQLLDHEAVREAVVVARGDRLDAYYVPNSNIEVETLRDALSEALPSYMVPSAFVELDALPLTPNGKVDRDKLPTPDGDAVVARGYQAPTGPVEEALAAIWADLLSVERVGRNDDFFELGGHSLLAVSLVEQMRQAGLSCDVRAVFTTPTVAGLATAVAAGGGTEVQVPPNAIPADAEAITPDMLPLVELTEEHITKVVSTVPGGAGNVQDIYPLAPLQEGIFFHHLMGGDADPYLVSYVLPINTRDEADQFVAALQAVVDRHDILRTSVVWEGLPQPVQVVWRHAELPVQEVTLDANEDAANQLLTRYDPRRYRMDLGAAPLMRVVRAYDEPNDRWLLLVLMHHIIDDNTSVGALVSEVDAHLADRADALPEPVPYRNVVAQAVLGTSREEHEEFFTYLLSDVDEPTAPYGILDVRGDGTGIAETHVDVDPALAQTVREQARQAGVSAATVCHLAWSMVLSRLTGRSDVVFGTVLFGRMQAGTGAERGLGLFINTLPIRIDVAERGVLDAARDTQRLLAELLRHEHAPLVLAQGCSQVPTGLPLFTTLLNYRHSPEPAEPVVGGLGDRVEVLHSEERTNYPIVVSIDDLGSGDAGFGITAQVDDRLNPDRICGLLIAALEELSRALAGNRSLPVADADVLPAVERALLVDGFNPVDASADPKLCLHEVFEAQVAATPDAVAAVHRDTQITYRELNEQANRIAYRLRAEGVSPGVRVGICAERGVGLLAAVVGVLKAGGAYVPLDPSYPAERVTFVLADAQPAVVLTDGVEPAALIQATAPEDVVVWDLATDFTHAPEGNVPTAVSPSDVAYVIYTSGSTGTPKGVLVEHRQVTRLFTATEEWFNFGPTDVWALCHSYAFDFSVWEIWGALLHGGRLVVVPGDVVRAPDELWQLMCSAGVTVLCQTPGAFTRLTDARLRTPDSQDQLRFVIFGGEALEVAALRPWFDATADGGPTLVNMYGITETTVHVTWQPISPNTAGGLGGSLIGQPIPDLHVYVIDNHGRPTPVGVVGELMVGGRGVTRGYLGRPGLTAERFVPNWLTADGTRLYRTGDLGRWLPDGTLEYIGRNDFQVKIRGYRIELGEIETRLLDLEVIREAIVIARGDRLDAYYVADTSIHVETLRDALGNVLPSYMVPSAFVELDALPLTPNGKVDRDKLPTPDGGAVVARGYQAPVGVVEGVLAGIWADLLGVERVGRNDDFFELGGHSLLAVSLVERMREAGLTCDVRAVFTTPTITGLATAVAAGGGTDLAVPPNAIPRDAEAITPEMLPLVELAQDHIDKVAASVPGGASNVQDIYPLGPLQEGIFFHHLMGGEGDAYLLSSVSAVPSREWVGEITDALQTVVNRHDILRTAVVWEGLPQPVQVVWRHAELPVEEVTLEGNEDAATQLLTRYDPRRYRMDLRAAPLLRVVTTYDAAHERWLVMMLMHHLVGDHTTLEMLQEEVGSALAGQASALPEPVPYRNAVAQAVLGTSREEHEKFFTDLLGDVDEPTAPYGILDVRGDGTGIAEAQAAIEPELAVTVREQARQAGVSPASMCHLAWSMVLSRLTGRSDVVFGTVMFGRMQAGAGAERGLGLFINTLPLRVEVDARGVRDAVRDTHGLLAEVLRHEHAPLVLAQGCSQVPAGLPLFTSLFNYRHSAPADPAAAEAAVSGVEVLHNEERTNYPVVVSVDDLGAEDNGFAITAQVDNRLDPERVCVLLMAALRELTGLLAADPTASVADVEVLPAAERALVVERFNATETPLDPTARVHDLFEAHAKTTPDAVAIVHGDTQVTYRGLNARANQIAHRLRSAGVGPDARVAICAQRGVPLLAAMLGVLKAGGAYVPLDPSYPAERLAFMLTDAQPAVILTDGVHLPAADMPVIELASLTDEPDTDLPNLASSTDMAYVLYTSGSTGLPKGVAVEHRNIVRLVVNNPSTQFTPDDRTAFAANPSFDAATWEIWGPLANGGTVVVIDQDDVLDPQQFATVLRAQSVSMLWMTVGLFNRTHTTLGDVLGQLRYLIVGGDILDPSAIATTVGGPQHLLNGYGPTETTTFAATHLIETVNTSRSVPIGRPIGNTRIYLVDNVGRPVPVGVTGELFIGGLGVARGYLGRPGLTAERFLPNWLTADGTRLYRTGDLGRWLPDGTIEFIGRNDFQVKIRGYRIELGEIETRLLQHHAIGEATVIARGDRLDAYYVPNTSIEVETLRNALSETLPSYMVPSAFVELDALPLTPNGKVDRDKLPSPDGDAVVTRGYQAPVGPVEEALAAIWADLLSVERIGRNDDFFELGGHSLLAVSLVEQMRQAGLSCDVRAVFTTPTITGLATAVAAGGSAEVQVPPNLIPDVHRSEADGGGKMEIDL